MDRNQILGFVLLFVIFVVYFQFFAPDPEDQARQQQITDSLAQVEKQHTAPKKTIKNSPKANASGQEFGTDSLPTDTSQQAAVNLKPSSIKVETETFEITFSNLGGRIESIKLKNHTDHKNKGLVLFNDSNLVEKMEISIGNQTIVTDEYLFELPSNNKEKINATDSAIYTFKLSLDAGKSLIRKYTVYGSGNQIKVNNKLTGHTFGQTAPKCGYYLYTDVRPFEYDADILRRYTTINYYTKQDGFDRLSPTGDSEDETVDGKIDWFALKQRFFTLGVISKQSFGKSAFKTKVDKNSYHGIETLEASATFDPQNLTTPNGQEINYYFGPNDLDKLETVTTGFGKNLYLGWSLVSYVNLYLLRPLFKFLENFIPNYGWLIIVMVFIIRMALLPLAYKSYIGMAKMKVLKPEMDELKEKFGDNQTQMQQEQMKMYRELGINPLAGCIPLLLQMPILLAMFFFFPNAIELRGVSFWWAHDLSTYDDLIRFPFTIPGLGNHLSLFTLLMTASTLLLTFFNNQTQSTQMQGPMKMMTYLMPVVFLFVLNSYPAGLTLYYLVSNLVSVGQQAAIRKVVNDDAIRRKIEENKKKRAEKPKSRFQQRLEESLKNKNTSNAPQIKKKPKRK